MPKYAKTIRRMTRTEIFCLSRPIFFLSATSMQSYLSIKIGIILPIYRQYKVIPLMRPERYNIIEVNDNAD